MMTVKMQKQVRSPLYKLKFFRSNFVAKGTKPGTRFFHQNVAKNETFRILQQSACLRVYIFLCIFF